MNFLKIFSAASFSLLLCASSTKASAIFSFDPNQWNLVAHAGNSGALFSGNSDLSSTYSYGTFTTNFTPSTPDFYRPFSDLVSANPDILFITGDHSQWAIFNYQSILDAISNHFGDTGTTNVRMVDVGLNGADIGAYPGTVLFRGPGAAEDPWITVGTHDQGVVHHQVFWGENGYNSNDHLDYHGFLFAEHGGMNVYVGNFTNITGGLTEPYHDSAAYMQIVGVPEPSTYALFGIGAIGMLIVLRRNKTA